MKDYPGKIKLVVKMLPYKYRDYAYPSAQAALAARNQGRFEAMHTLLLEKTPKLDRDSLVSYAKELKLDVDRFTKELDGLANKKEIDRDLALAKSLDLFNTPTFYINGIKLVGDRPYEAFKEIVDRELKSAGGAK